MRKSCFFKCFKTLKGNFFGFSFNVHYSTLLHLPLLRFHFVGGCWDRTQDCCDFGIESQTLQPLGYVSSTAWLDLIHTWLDIIHEHTISLRFLGIIFRVFRLAVSIYNVYCTVHYKLVSNYFFSGGGGGVKSISRGYSE
jgi:hypothetical protein